ncbi:MAG: hypothetical protein JNK67_25225 [Alphaproteobacteria bacterium]|nr:hypothetical protein [Alphaproteobacteria bacterium]
MNVFERVRREFLGRLALAPAFGAGVGSFAQAATHIEAGASLRFDGDTGPEAVGPGVDRIEGTISGGDEAIRSGSYFPSAAC